MGWDYPSLCLLGMREPFGTGGALNWRALAGAQRRFALPHRPGQCPPLQGMGVRGAGVMFGAAFGFAMSCRDRLLELELLHFEVRSPETPHKRLGRGMG